MNKRIAVVGAGMAGISAAYELARTPNITVQLFEASSRLGGTVETVTVLSGSGGQFVIECGPDSWVSDKPAARDLAIELGLQDELIYSNDARRRNYLARTSLRGRGELTPMPDGMRMMVPTRWAPILESPLFTWQARLAYLREPKRAAELKQFAQAQDAQGEDADESVASFIRRHFGDEATETVAGPLLAGVFGGDVEKLSARAVLAPFVRMERDHGSLVTAVMERAARQQAEQGAPQPIFTTLRSGLQTLVDRMAATFTPGTVHLQARVTALRPARSYDGGAADKREHCLRESQQDNQQESEQTGWHLVIAGAAPGEPDREESFDAVILATPAHVTRELLQPLDHAASQLLAMDATSAIVVALAYEPAIAASLRIPRGFGFLVPPGEALSAEPSLLAGTFMDQKFPFRAPDGGVFLRGFFGGQAAPRMLHWSDEAIVEAARTQFSRFVGPLPAASHAIVRRWPRSLPQYAVGHITRMRTLADHIDRMPGLSLVGNAYQGVGLPNLVEHGRSAARAMFSHS